MRKTLPVTSERAHKLAIRRPVLTRLRWLFAWVLAGCGRPGRREFLALLAAHRHATQAALAARQDPNPETAELAAAAYATWQQRLGEHRDARTEDAETPDTARKNLSGKDT